jgi:drug/metabolite transporter (DMT)-like permease
LPDQKQINDIGSNPEEEDLGGDPQSGGKLTSFLARINPMQLRNQGQRTKALFALSLVCFFWGTTWIASKAAVRHMPALQMAGMRQFLGGLLYVIFFSLRKSSWPKGREWSIILVLSFLNFFMSNCLSTWSMQYISAGLGSIIGAIFPLWLVVISLFSPHTKLGSKAIIGVVLGFAGVCIIFYEYLADFFKPGFRFGIFICMLSTWTWAFGTLYTKKHATGFNPYFSLGLQMVISGIGVSLVAYTSGEVISIGAIPWQSWASIGYLTVFGSVISFIAYLYALQHLPMAQVSLYAYINPIVAILAGWMLFNELLTPFIGIGALVTLYGVYLVNRSINKVV